MAPRILNSAPDVGECLALSHGHFSLCKETPHLMKEDLSSRIATLDALQMKGVCHPCRQSNRSFLGHLAHIRVNLYRLS